MAHKLKQVSGETTYCGDHYCTGHNKVTIECEVCGPIDKGYGHHVDRGELKTYELEHRLDMLERKAEQ